MPGRQSAYAVQRVRLAEEQMKSKLAQGINVITIKAESSFGCWGPTIQLATDPTLEPVILKQLEAAAGKLTLKDLASELAWLNKTFEDVTAAGNHFSLYFTIAYCVIAVGLWLAFLFADILPLEVLGISVPIAALVYLGLYSAAKALFNITYIDSKLPSTFIRLNSQVSRVNDKYAARSVTWTGVWSSGTYTLSVDLNGKKLATSDSVAAISPAPSAGIGVKSPSDYERERRVSKHQVSANQHEASLPNQVAVSVSPAVVSEVKEEKKEEGKEKEKEKEKKEEVKSAGKSPLLDNHSAAGDV